MLIFSLISERSSAGLEAHRSSQLLLVHSSPSLDSTRTGQNFHLWLFRLATVAVPNQDALMQRLHDGFQQLPPMVMDVIRRTLRDELERAVHRKLTYQ